MTCDYCGGLKGDGSHCYCCEKQWDNDLRNNANIPRSILQKIKGLPMEQKKKIFPLESWQPIRQQEREYGFELHVAHLGDEDDPEVIQKREEMERVIRSVVNSTIERYNEIVNGITKPKPEPTPPVDYAHIRYGRDF